MTLKRILNLSLFGVFALPGVVLAQAKIGLKARAALEKTFPMLKEERPK
jgi:hypothetical protein